MIEGFSPSEYFDRQTRRVSIPANLLQEYIKGALQKSISALFGFLDRIKKDDYFNGQNRFMYLGIDRKASVFDNDRRSFVVPLSNKFSIYLQQEILKQEILGVKKIFNFYLVGQGEDVKVDGRAYTSVEDLIVFSDKLIEAISLTTENIVPEKQEIIKMISGITDAIYESRTKSEESKKNLMIFGRDCGEKKILMIAHQQPQPLPLPQPDCQTSSPQQT